MNSNLEKSQILIEHDRFKEAIELINAYLSENIDDGKAYTLLALALNNNQNYRDAQTAAEKAISLCPEDSAGFYVLSLVYLNCSYLDESKKNILEALRLDPDDADYCALAAAIEAKKLNWNKSEFFSRKGLENDPSHKESMISLALSLDAQGKKAEAEEVYIKLLSLYPEESSTHVSRGWNALKSSKINQASYHFNQALRIDPDNRYARSGLSHALKSCFWPYHKLLQLSIWLGAFKKYQFLLLTLVSYIVVGRLMAELNPPSIVLLLFLFIFPITTVFLVLISKPYTDLLLLMSKNGRKVLTDSEKSTVKMTVFLSFIAATSIFIGSYTIQRIGILFAVACLAYTVPISFLNSPDHSHKAVKNVCICFAIIGVLATFLYSIGVISEELYWLVMIVIIIISISFN